MDNRFLNPAQPAKNADKVAAGKDTVNRRRDFQPLDDTPSPNGRVPKNKLPESYLYRARDLVTRMLEQPGRCAPRLHQLFVEVSLDKVKSLKYNTAKSLLSDFKSWLVFVNHIETQARRHDPHTQIAGLPASDALLRDYVHHLRHRGTDKPPATVQTVQRHVASLVKWHGILELPSPVSTKTETALEELRNHVDESPRQKQPLRLDHVQSAMRALDAKVLRDVADMALLLVAYETLLRRSNLVAINVDHLTTLDDGGATLLVPRTKTSKDHRGHVKYLCPGTMSVVRYWMDIAGIRRGALFRGVYSDNTLSERMDSKTVAVAFKRIARRIGHGDEWDIGGHSTRIGAVVDLAAREVDSTDIMLAGNWADIRMVAHYRRGEDVRKSKVSSIMTTELGNVPTYFLEKDVST